MPSGMSAKNVGSAAGHTVSDRQQDGYAANRTQASPRFLPVHLGCGELCTP